MVAPLDQYLRNTVSNLNAALAAALRLSVFSSAQNGNNFITIRSQELPTAMQLQLYNVL